MMQEILSSSVPMMPFTNQQIKSSLRAKVDIMLATVF